MASIKDSNQNPFVAIVDAYSTGQYLAPRFKERGFRCIHIKSEPSIPKILSNSFHPEDFEVHFTAPNNPVDLLEQLNQYPLLCVIPGTETGVLLADFLSEHLNLFTEPEQNYEFYRSIEQSLWVI